MTAPGALSPRDAAPRVTGEDPGGRRPPTLLLRAPRDSTSKDVGCTNPSPEARDSKRVSVTACVVGGNLSLRGWGAKLPGRVDV